MSNWTEGPWNCALVKVQHSINCPSGPIAYTRCNVDAEQDAANARLIAAAPELVDAVRQFVNGMDLYERGIYLSQKDQDAIIGRARAALTKAGAA